MPNSVIRVASVPSSHVYVRHLSPVSKDSPVRRLPDPIPADGRKVPGGWWPPLMLDPQWIARNHDEFDIFHIHFGFDAISPATMADVVHELAVHHKPLVYTLHDLRNPHHPTARAHDEVLDVLVPAADAVVTLTPGAAAEIEKRWGRTATVLPHPHVVPRERFDRIAPRAHDEFVVGVHAKSVRANMDPLPVIRALLHTAEFTEDMVVQVNVHDEIFDPGNHWYNPDFGASVIGLRDHARARVHVHPYFSDAELWDYLDSLSASVLPYRFGTHSGWLEACHDLGVPVIAPTCGFYDQQHFSTGKPACRVYDLDEQSFDPASLATAVKDLRSSPSAPRASWVARAEQRGELDRAHTDLYNRCLDG